MSNQSDLILKIKLPEYCNECKFLNKEHICLNHNRVSYSEIYGLKESVLFHDKILNKFKHKDSEFYKEFSTNLKKLTYKKCNLKGKTIELNYSSEDTR